MVFFKCEAQGLSFSGSFVFVFVPLSLILNTFFPSKPLIKIIMGIIVR